MYHYPFHLGDYLTHTAHLTPMEDLAYRRLLDRYYQQESALVGQPADLARLIRLPTEVQAVETVLREFFSLEGTDTWINARAEEEIRRYEAAAVRARENGKHGGRPKKTQSVPTGNPAGTQTKPDRKLTKNQEPREKNKDGSSSSDEEELLVLGSEKPAAADAPPAKINGYHPPPIDYEAIVTAYHQTLPQLPAVVALNEGRKKTLKARWREVCVGDKLDQAAAIQFFRDYFARVARSNFLMGRAKPKDGGAAFVASFDWLIAPRNFIKVIEGNYDPDRRRA